MFIQGKHQTASDLVEIGNEKKRFKTDDETQESGGMVDNAGRFTKICDQPLATEFQHEFMFTCLTASS